MLHPRSVWRGVAAVCGVWSCLSLSSGVDAQAPAPPAPPTNPYPGITIAVSPPRFELELDRGGATEAIRVMNFGQEPTPIEVSVHAWELDENTQVRLVAPDEQSLGQWMIISPLRFTIPPGGSQTVRFSIRPKVEPTPGEHRALIYFQQTPRADAAVQIVGRLGVAVYAYAGEPERTGRLNGIAINTEGPAARATFDISALGNAHVRLSGQYAVWPAEYYPGAGITRRIDRLGETEVELPAGMVDAGFLPGVPVLPGTQQRLPMALVRQLPPGRYVLDINGDLSGEAVVLGVPFVVEGADGGGEASR